MNNGNYLKKFFTAGCSSSKIVENFIKTWRHGSVEHIPLAANQPEESSIELNGEFISLFVTDSDLASLNLLKSNIERLKTPQGIEIIILAETQLCQYESIACTEYFPGSTPLVVLRDSLDCILECYAHYLCGFSFTCLDYYPICNWLHAGSTHISAGCNNVPPNELPYRLYLEIKKLEENAHEQRLHLVSINGVFLGTVWPYELLEASACMHW